MSEYLQDPSINNNVPGQYISRIANVSSTNPQVTVLDDIPLANPISGARYIHGGADKLAFAVLGNLENKPWWALLCGSVPALCCDASDYLVWRVPL